MTRKFVNPSIFFKNSVGNVEAKELIFMTHGHELKAGNVSGRGCAGWKGIKGGEWDTVIV